MPKEGFEPSWVYTHYALNVARLPVPPLRLTQCILSAFAVLSTFFKLSGKYSIIVFVTML